MGEAGGESLEGLEWGAGWGTHSALWVCGCGEVAGVGKGSALGWEQLWDAELEHPQHFGDSQSGPAVPSSAATSLL